MSLLKSVKKAVKTFAGGPNSLLDSFSGGANTKGGLAIASALLPGIGKALSGQDGISGLFGKALSGEDGQGGISGLFGSLLNGAVGVGSDYLQSQYNLQMKKDLAKYNAKQQTKLNDRAFQQNIDMWNMKNAYDSPAEQMKRYEAAGLNKNLIYGQSNTSGSAPEATPANFDTGPYSPVDNRMQRAQLALALEEQHQRVINQSIQNDLDRQRLALSAQASKREDALAQAQIKAMGANLGIATERNSLTAQNNALLSQDRNDRLAFNKWKAAHDSWLRQSNDLKASKYWFWANKDERRAMLYKAGLYREPQLRDFY